MNYNDLNKAKNPRSTFGSQMGAHIAKEDNFQRAAEAKHVGSANSGKFKGATDVMNKGDANCTK